MGKRLSEMTLDALWKLFPIQLTPHKAAWKTQYAEMASFLKERLASFQIVRISHIGSTAVETIWAKPIVDILVEIDRSEKMSDVAAAIEKSGFLRMSETQGRVSFNFGYTESGFAEKVFHLHLRQAGDHDELYFRDYLNDHADIAQAYQRLKLRLWRQYAFNRDAYTDAKTAFVRQYTAEAKAAYADRY